MVHWLRSYNERLLFFAGAVAFIERMITHGLGIRPNGTELVYRQTENSYAKNRKAMQLSFVMRIITIFAI